jgi:hypothetical protein
MHKYDRVINPGHISLCYINDFADRHDFETFVSENYTEHQLVEFEVVGYVCDDLAFVLLVKSKLKYMQTQSRSCLYATVMVNGSSTKPIYGGQLISKAFSDNTLESRLRNSIVLKYFDQPVKFLGQIKLFRSNSTHFKR